MINDTILCLRGYDVTSACVVSDLQNMYNIAKTVLHWATPSVFIVELPKHHDAQERTLSASKYFHLFDSANQSFLIIK